MSLYVQLHADLRHHPKLWALCDAVGWTEFEALGRLSALWMWSLEHRPSGKLGDQFAHATRTLRAAWQDECANGDVFRALCECGFVDEADDGFTLHDWDEYGGKLHAKREAGRARAKKSRSKASSAKSARTVRESSAPRGEERREEKSTTTDVVVAREDARPETTTTTTGQVPVHAQELHFQGIPDERSARMKTQGQDIPPELVAAIRERWGQHAEAGKLVPIVEWPPSLTAQLRNVLANTSQGNRLLELIDEAARRPGCNGEGNRGWRLRIDQFLEPEAVVQLATPGGKWSQVGTRTRRAAVVVKGLDDE